MTHPIHHLSPISPTTHHLEERKALAEAYLKRVAQVVALTQKWGGVEWKVRMEEEVEWAVLWFSVTHQDLATCFSSPTKQ